MLTKEEQMEPEMTCTSNDTTEKMKFYMAMELSQKEWKLGFSVGPGRAHGRWRFFLRRLMASKWLMAA
jgi:hypothetical protein